jgi:hypothetical protein
MNLFLDRSVVLAACLSGAGASRLIFESAQGQGWGLVVSPWVLREVRVNLAGMENTALTEWGRGLKSAGAATAAAPPRGAPRVRGGSKRFTRGPCPLVTLEPVAPVCGPGSWECLAYE